MRVCQDDGEPRRRAELGRAGPVTPARHANNYSALDLRLVLARLPERLSAPRVAAAIAVLGIAVAAWLTIPASASTASTTGCLTPQPAVSVDGPTRPASGPTAIVAVTVQRLDSIGAPSIVSVTLPPGYGYAALPAGAVRHDGTLEMTLPATRLRHPATVAVHVSVGGAHRGAAITVSHAVNLAGDARCRGSRVTSISALTLGAASDGRRGGREAPVAVTDAPISDAVAIPLTGAGSSVLRPVVVGLCLLVSGLLLATGVRRNPHADAVAGWTG